MIVNRYVAYCPHQHVLGVSQPWRDTSNAGRYDVQGMSTHFSSKRRRMSFGPSFNLWYHLGIARLLMIRTETEQNVKSIRLD